jgi:hypothetical protein
MRAGEIAGAHSLSNLNCSDPEQQQRGILEQPSFLFTIQPVPETKPGWAGTGRNITK